MRGSHRFLHGIPVHSGIFAGIPVRIVLPVRFAKAGVLLCARILPFVFRRLLLRRHKRLTEREIRSEPRVAEARLHRRAACSVPFILILFSGLILHMILSRLRN